MSKQGSVLDARTAPEKANPDVRRLLSHCTRAWRALGILALASIGLGLCALAEAQTLHSITISWSYTQGTDLAAGFNVYRSTTNGGPYTQINPTILPLTTLSFADTVNVGGVKYYYVVRAVDAEGKLSPDSVQVSAVSDAASAAPLAPTGITAVAK